MTIERETFSELLHSMIFAYAGQQLSLPQVASVLWACAQPATVEEVEDMTHKVREMLTDWSEMDKGMLIAIENVKMTFECVNIHGPCKKGKHTVNMTRVIGSMDWEPENVTSIHNFSDVIVEATVGPDPKGKIISRHRRGGGPHDLIAAFRDMFLEEPEQTIEREMDAFRKELDELFPSNPQKGGSDETERPTT